MLRSVPTSQYNQSSFFRHWNELYRKQAHVVDAASEQGLKTANPTAGERYIGW